MTQRTPEEIAKIYAETIYYGQSNGWGQYCHPDYGQSHQIMQALISLVGRDGSDRLISIAMREVRNAT